MKEISSDSWESLLDSLHDLKCVQDIENAIEIIADYFGFKYYLYGERIPTSFVKASNFAISNYPVEWREIYQENQYERLDPAVFYCAKNILPATWESIFNNHIATLDDPSDTLEFVNQAAVFELVDGVSIPVRGWNGEAVMLSFCAGILNDEEKQMLIDYLPYLQNIAFHLFEAVHKVDLTSLLTDEEDDHVNGPRRMLTRKEEECLLWTVEGKSAWEVSQILKISEKTVEYHLKNIFDKLDVHSKHQATAKAVVLGLISPKF